MSSLATRVKERLKEVGMTPAELARAAKVRPPSVSDWMSGETKTIKGENLLRAAKALQCSPDWLATGVGAKTSGEAQSKAHTAREETVSYITDKLVEEGAEILRKLDRRSRSEALHWLRGYAAGRKIEPSGGSHGHGDPLARTPKSK